MRVTYTGRHVDLAPAQWSRIEAQFSKLGKMLDGKGSKGADEQEARVILSLERHLCKAEVTLNYHDHPLVGLAADPDLFTAIHGAVGKLEKQAIKVRTKWRESFRNGKEHPEAEPEPVAAEAEKQKVFHVVPLLQDKPLVLEEALLAMSPADDYYVFHDAQADCPRVLIRRRDGHLDLLEL